MKSDKKQKQPKDQGSAQLETAVLGLSKEQWDELETFIGIRLKQPRHVVGSILWDFGTIFIADSGLLAMYKFLKWARANKQDDAWTFGEIMHDLNDRRDEFMSPRTSSYIDVDLNKLNKKDGE